MIDEDVSVDVLAHRPHFDIRAPTYAGRRHEVIREVALAVRPGDLLTGDRVEAETVPKTGKVSRGGMNAAEKALVVRQEDLRSRVCLAVAGGRSHATGRARTAQRDR